MEICSNCGGKIGNLEQSCTFEGNVVCHECWQKLRRQQSSTLSDSETEASLNGTSPAKKKKSGVRPSLVVLAVIAGALYYFGGGFEYDAQETMETIERQAAVEMRRIENQVAADAVKEYQIAKRSGTAMDAYVQAGLVAAAYLQANDEPNFKKWKEIEKAEARRAGITP